MDAIKRIPLHAGRAETWANGAENMAVHLTYDMSDELAVWPDAAPSVAFERADGEKYPHAWELDGPVLHIPLLLADTEIPGMCKCMITLTSGDGWANTAVYYGSVTQGIDTLGEEPTDPQQGIIEQVNAAAARAEEAAESALSASGYYTPSVTQPDDTTMRVAYTPSTDKLPALEAVDIALPKGEKGEPGQDAEPYTLPVASADTLGGVKVGEGLEVTDDGKINTEVKKADVDKLSEEIDEIINKDVTTKTATVVTADATENIVFTVSANDAEAGEVTLVHQGKNFCPSGLENVPNYEGNGVTITANADGSHRIVGTASAGVYYYLMLDKNGTGRILPAGDYTISLSLKGTGTVILSTYKKYLDGTSDGGISPATQQQSVVRFTLASPAQMQAFLHVPSGVTVDAIVSVQYEYGNASTDYEKYVAQDYTQVLPITVDAYDGTNVFYTTSGDVITVKYKPDAAADMVEAVTQKLKFDPSPYKIPVLYLTGDTTGMTKDNPVSMTYEYGDMLPGSCEVKWQGSSSLKYPKKNYTIKFDTAFEAKEGWGAQKKYCFKANWIDASHARNVVAAKLWGKVIASRKNADVYLAACPNYGAIDGFPCVIMLNGEFHGLFTWNIPKDGWMLNFPTEGETQQCILCANGHLNAADSFEALETELGKSFDVEYITNEDDTGWALASLNNLISACIATDGSDLDTTIAAMLDWDSVIDYFIFSVLTANYDGIIKNYLLYTKDGTKWGVGPYDLDCLWGNWWDGSEIIPARQSVLPANIMMDNHLYNLVGTHKAEAIKARYEELRNGALSEDSIATEVANFIGCIPFTIYAEERKAWPEIPITSVDGLHQITDWYRRRLDRVDPLIDAL